MLTRDFATLGLGFASLRVGKSFLRFGDMAKLANAQDLKSCGEILEGSSPSIPILSQGREVRFISLGS